MVICWILCGVAVTPSPLLGFSSSLFSCLQRQQHRHRNQEPSRINTVTHQVLETGHLKVPGSQWNQARTSCICTLPA
jgi:hypothetical protein